MVQLCKCGALLGSAGGGPGGEEEAQHGRSMALKAGKGWGHLGNASGTRTGSRKVAQAACNSLHAQHWPSHRTGPLGRPASAHSPSLAVPAAAQGSATAMPLTTEELTLPALRARYAGGGTPTALCRELLPALAASRAVFISRPSDEEVLERCRCAGPARCRLPLAGGWVVPWAARPQRMEPLGRGGALACRMHGGGCSCRPSHLAVKPPATVACNCSMSCLLRRLCPTCRRALEAQPADQRGPLWGVPFAVKDNIDVAGHPTTAACREFEYVPSQHARAVQPLLDAGTGGVGLVRGLGLGVAPPAG